MHEADALWISVLLCRLSTKALCFIHVSGLRAACYALSFYLLLCSAPFSWFLAILLFLFNVFFGVCVVFVVVVFLFVCLFSQTCRLWEPPSRSWLAAKFSPWAFSRKAFASVDHSGHLTSARLTLKEEIIRDRVIKCLHPINRFGVSYSRAKYFKFRSLLPCIDLCEWFEDLQTSQRRPCQVIRDRSALPSTFYMSGEMCPLPTASQSWRLSCSRRGCCGMLMGSPALNEDVVMVKLLYCSRSYSAEKDIDHWTNNVLLTSVCQWFKE